ncbi:MAG: DUF308 domain-containing protein [Bacilli bacterium]
MLKDKQLEYISSILTILNGLICIIYGEKLLILLPIICGSILLLKGLIQFIEGIKNKDYNSLEKTNLEKSFILIAIGLGILIKRSDDLFIVGMFWGLNGLIKASNYLKVALYNFCNKEKWITILIKSIIEFGLSLMLIFNPFGKLEHHIFILGVELIFDGSIEFISKYKNKKRKKLKGIC